MDSLSPELIHEIFHHLDDKLDVARFRLVQRTFAELGKEALFSCIYVQPSQQSLSRLLEIARHPSCAQYVRMVALSVDAMKIMVWRPFTEQVGSKITDNIDYQTLAIFRNIVDECQNFQQSSDYAAMLSASFSRLPRLSALALCEVSSSTYPRSETLTLMDRYAHAVDPPQFHGSWGEKDHLRGFSALIDAAYFAGTTLDSFTTDGLIDQALFDNRLLLSRAKSVFRHCRVLKLLFCGEEPLPALYRHPLAPRMLETPLFDILAPALDLEELAVGFSACPMAGRGGELFTRTLGRQHVWPKLREVNLGTIDLPYQELLAFLDRHRATLRGFTVSCCNLVGGSWGEVMMSLRDSMKLKRLGLNGTLSDASTTLYSSRELAMMMDYVLNGGKCLPGGLRLQLDGQQLPRNTESAGSYVEQPRAG